MNDKDSLQVHNVLRLLVKSSVIVFIGIFLSKVLSYFYRIIVARYFGPEVYGLYNLGIMITGWIVALATLGLVDGLHRFLPYYRGKKDIQSASYLFRFTLKTLAISTIFSALILFFLAGYIATLFHNPSLERIIQFFSITIPLLALSYPFLASIRAFEQTFWYSFTFYVSQNATKLIFLALLVILGLSTDAVIFSYVLGILAMLLCAIFAYKKYVSLPFATNKISGAKKSKLRKEFTSYSYPLLLFGVLSSLYYWVDSFFLGYYKDATIVGFYNAAVPIAIFLAIVPELFMQLFFPLINKAYATKKFDTIKKISKQVAKWIYFVNIPLFILVFIFPEVFLNLFFGEQYLAAASPLRILALSNLISSVFLVSNNLLSMLGRSKTVLLNITLGTIANIVLNAIMIPMPLVFNIDNSNGMVGAAIATLISMTFMQFLFAYQVYSSLKVLPVKRKMITLTLIAAVLSVFLALARSFIEHSFISFIIAAIIFTIAYVLLALLFKAYDENDQDIINTITKRLPFKLKLT